MKLFVPPGLTKLKVCMELLNERVLIFDTAMFDEVSNFSFICMSANSIELEMLFEW